MLGGKAEIQRQPQVLHNLFVGYVTAPFWSEEGDLMEDVKVLGRSFVGGLY